MKMKIFPICLSFLFAGIYFAGGVYFISCFIESPVRNFVILWIPQALISAGDYAALGILLCANKLDRTKACIIFTIAAFFAVGPLAILILTFWFLIFLPFGIETFLLFFAPILLCALPLVMIFTTKDDSSSSCEA